MTEKMALARADAVAFYPEERMYAAGNEWVLTWLPNIQILPTSVGSGWLNCERATVAAVGGVTEMLTYGCLHYLDVAAVARV